MSWSRMFAPRGPVLVCPSGQRARDRSQTSAWLSKIQWERDHTETLYLRSLLFPLDHHCCMQLQAYMLPQLLEEQCRNAHPGCSVKHRLNQNNLIRWMEVLGKCQTFTFGVYSTQRQLERSQFLSDEEQDVTNLTCSDTPSVTANLFSSSRYSTFSLRRLSYPP